ncbi:DNA polymerase [Salmonella phage 18-India]|nr:DNA polymerase [Salmonella phage 18-India]
MNSFGKAILREAGNRERLPAKLLAKSHQLECRSFRSTTPT